MITAFVIFAAAIPVLFWLHRLWSKQVAEEMKGGAEVQWGVLSAQSPDLLAGLDQQRFAEIYRATHFPRAPGYALYCYTALVLGTPVLLGLFSACLAVASALGLRPEPFHIHGFFSTLGGGAADLVATQPEIFRYLRFDAAGIYIFFGMILGWVAVVSYFARRFYKTAPGSLREEIIRAR